MKCPKCGSENVKKGIHSTTKILGVPKSTDSYKCNDCGHTWKEEDNLDSINTLYNSSNRNYGNGRHGRRGGPLIAILLGIILLVIGIVIVVYSVSDFTANIPQIILGIVLSALGLFCIICAVLSVIRFIKLLKKSIV